MQEHFGFQAKMSQSREGQATIGRRGQGDSAGQDRACRKGQVWVGLVGLGLMGHGTALQSLLDSRQRVHAVSVVKMNNATVL
jgi:hypothetical protein